MTRNRLLVIVAVSMIFSLAITGTVQAGPKTRKQPTVIRLKNGNSISGFIVSEDKNKVIVEWQGNQIGFSRGEIAEIKSGEKLSEKNGIRFADSQGALKSQKNDVVVKLTNGQILDEKILSMRDECVYLKKDLGDGDSAELGIPVKKIESLEFRPVLNPESSKIEQTLRKQFPKMSFYRLGMVTLVTDTDGSSLKILKRVIRDQQMLLYFRFFDLVRDLKPAHQNYVVVFDKINQYFEYALSSGVPPWLCPGYFSPKEKTLFMMNYIGDEFSKLIYAAVTTGRDSIDKQDRAIKQRVDARYHNEVDNIARDAKLKWEDAVAYINGLFYDETLNTLRHELTHELFFNWGLQNIILSKTGQTSEELVKKKRELLETNDLKKKKRLILEILRMRKKEGQKDKDIKIEAANSWFVEGLAEYAATTANDLPNNGRLYSLKESKKRNELWPLEQLTVYRMGSFPGIANRYMLQAYAQSWSFVEFLMKNYRGPFIAYLKRMAHAAPSKDQDLVWLLEATKKDLRTLETEWHAYIDELKDVEDPEVEQIVRVHEILKDAA